MGWYLKALFYDALNFHGRANRKEFWIVYLVNFII